MGKRVGENTGESGGEDPDGSTQDGDVASGEKDRLTYAGVLWNQGVGIPPVHQG